MKKLILLIPHSATKIPIKEGFILGDEIIENIKLGLNSFRGILELLEGK